jgi:hypothetical protein
MTIIRPVEVKVLDSGMIVPEDPRDCDSCSDLVCYSTKGWCQRVHSVICCDDSIFVECECYPQKTDYLDLLRFG